MEELTPRRRDSDRPRGRMRKGMYILPSLFTTANIAAGFFAILETARGSRRRALAFRFRRHGHRLCRFLRRTRRPHRPHDPHRKRLSATNSIRSPMSSPLALLRAPRVDVGLPPAPGHAVRPNCASKSSQVGTIACFAFLMAGASRLARFNITTNPQPSNPGRPGKKYFVGMPIPAGAGVIAAVVHFLRRRAARLLAHLAELASDGDGRRLPDGQHLALLQLQRHRFPLPPSFPPDRHSRHRRLAIWFFSGPVLFAIAVLYMASGILWRLQWIFRRKSPPAPPPSHPASLTS